MQFEPIGGFPSIIRIDESDIDEKTLETRGFVTTNIVSISNIMDSKKKENLFMAFGSEDEDGVDLAIDNMLDNKPYQYSDIEYKDVDYKRKSTKRTK